jgi:hypothetical protein
MTPAPNLQELIDTVHADAASADALDQLAAASHTVADLEAVADAVLGHFVDQCRRSGHSWSEISAALGVSKQAAHKRFSFAGLERFATPTFERFTQRARSALRAATEAAGLLGHSYVGTEHLLLGLFEPKGGGIAAQILDELGITRAHVEERILLVTPRGSAPLGGNQPLTPRAKAALGEALAEALALGHNYIGTEHLLLALFGDPSGLAAKILSDLGAQRDDVRNRVVAKLAGFSKP